MPGNKANSSVYSNGHLRPAHHDHTPVHLRKVDLGIVLLNAAVPLSTSRPGNKRKGQREVRSAPMCNPLCDDQAAPGKSCKAEKGVAEEKAVLKTNGSTMVSCHRGLVAVLVEDLAPTTTEALYASVFDAAAAVDASVSCDSPHKIFSISLRHWCYAFAGRHAHGDGPPIAWPQLHTTRIGWCTSPTLL